MALLQYYIIAISFLEHPDYFKAVVGTSLNTVFFSENLINEIEKTA